MDRTAEDWDRAISQANLEYDLALDAFRDVESMMWDKAFNAIMAESTPLDEVFQMMQVLVDGSVPDLDEPIVGEVVLDDPEELDWGDVVPD